MKICDFDHDGNGPRCCVEIPAGAERHDGPHMFRCCGPSCPGLMWPASLMAHPITCNTPSPATGAR